MCLDIPLKPHVVIGRAFSDVVGSSVCVLGLIHDAKLGSRALGLRV